MVFADYKNKLARLVFLNEAVTMPTAYYIGFSTTAPNEDGSGITEPASGTGYARKELVLTDPVDGVVANESMIDYGEALADWGTVTYLIVYDQNGVALFANALVAPFTVRAGDLVRIKAGDATLYFTEAAASV